MSYNESEKERERLNVSKEDIVSLDIIEEKKYFGCIPSSTLNVIWLGIVFMIVFTSFAPTQNFQSTLNEKWGFWNLSVLYVFFSLSNFISPLIVNKLGEKYSLILGALMYLIYVGCNALFSKFKDKLVPVLLISAALNGFGAAVIWTAQGAYITKNSTSKTIGRNNGIFYGIFQIHQVAGNLIAQILSNSSMAPPLMFIILTGIGSFGFILFFFLRHPPDYDIKKEPEPISTQITGVFKILTNKKMYLLIVIFLYSGFSHSYAAGKYTQFVGKENLGYAMAVYGAANALLSFVAGKAYDKLGSKFVMIVASFFIVLPCFLILILGKYFFQANPWIVYLCAIFMGVSDSGFNSQLSAILGIMFADNLRNAFGAFKLVQSSTGAISYFIGPYIDIVIASVILMSLLSIGVLLVLFLDLFIESTDRKRK